MIIESDFFKKNSKYVHDVLKQMRLMSTNDEVPHDFYCNKYQ